VDPNGVLRVKREMSTENIIFTLQIQQMLLFVRGLLSKSDPSSQITYTGFLHKLTITNGHEL